MIRKDYILKEIQKLHLLIAKVLGLKNEGKHHNALRVLDEHVVGESGLTLVDVEHMDNEGLINKLMETSDLKLVEYNILAEVAYEAAELKRIIGKEQEAINLYTKSLILFNHVTAEERIFDFQREQKISDINQAIKELSV
ncbi:hypothetical protein LVD15_18375 [Fulvivirga maritima]|uniref:hypothetical protein n=1 Tax=Fulvivirga maritima TaxID=2904247 RepID=UPI001F4032F6|nr:hypothetical protein [Fulvivirga maritima]UII25261.1 hypothetical protein LVD15_18375 [Fulvivirga maritima]